jgi:hypothetical protein
VSVRLGRWPVTESVMGLISDLGMPCGLLDPPDGAGWSGGTPGVGVFTPYAVVNPGPGAPAQPTTMGVCLEWDVTYRMRVWALLPDVCENMVDALVEQLHGAKPEVGGVVLGNPFLVQGVGDLRHDINTGPEVFSCDVTVRVTVEVPG